MSAHGSQLQAAAGHQSGSSSSWCSAGELLDPPGELVEAKALDLVGPALGTDDSVVGGAKGALAELDVEQPDGGASTDFAGDRLDQTGDLVVGFERAATAAHADAPFALRLRRDAK